MSAAAYARAVGWSLLAGAVTLLKWASIFTAVAVVICLAIALVASPFYAAWAAAGLLVEGVPARLLAAAGIVVLALVRL